MDSGFDRGFDISKKLNKTVEIKVGLCSYWTKAFLADQKTKQLYYMVINAIYIDTSHTPRKHNFVTLLLLEDYYTFQPANNIYAKNNVNA